MHFISLSGEVPMDQALASNESIFILDGNINNNGTFTEQVRASGLAVDFLIPALERDLNYTNHAGFNYFKKRYLHYQKLYPLRVAKNNGMVTTQSMKEEYDSALFEIVGCGYQVWHPIFLKVIIETIKHPSRDKFILKLSEFQWFCTRHDLLPGAAGLIAIGVFLRSEEAFKVLKFSVDQNSKELLKAASNAAMDMTYLARLIGLQDLFKEHSVYFVTNDKALFSFLNTNRVKDVTPHSTLLTYDFAPAENFRERMSEDEYKLAFCSRRQEVTINPVKYVNNGRFEVYNEVNKELSELAG